MREAMNPIESTIPIEIVTLTVANSLESQKQLSPKTQTRIISRRYNRQRLEKSLNSFFPEPVNTEETKYDYEDKDKKMMDSHKTVDIYGVSQATTDCTLTPASYFTSNIVKRGIRTYISALSNQSSTISIDSSTTSIDSSTPKTSQERISDILKKLRDSPLPQKTKNKVKSYVMGIAKEMEMSHPKKPRSHSNRDESYSNDQVPEAMDISVDSSFDSDVTSDSLMSLSVTSVVMKSGNDSLYGVSERK